MRNMVRFSEMAEYVRQEMPKSLMLQLFIAKAIPQVYALLNRYWIGTMAADTVIVEQSYEALEIVSEIIEEMFPLAVLHLVARHYVSLSRARRYVFTAVALQIGLSIAMTLIVIFTCTHLVNLLNVTGRVKEDSITYLRIQSLSMPFSHTSTLFLYAIKSLQYSRTAILLASIITFVNVLLDIFVISDLRCSLNAGIMGSAWNRLGSQGVQFFLTLGTFLYISRPAARAHQKEISDDMAPGEADPEEPLPKSSVSIRARVLASSSEIAIDDEDTRSIDKPFGYKQAAWDLWRFARWSGAESAIKNVGYMYGMIIAINVISEKEEAAIGGYNTSMTILYSVALVPVLIWIEATQMIMSSAFGSRLYRVMKLTGWVSTLIMCVYMLIWLIGGYWMWPGLSRWLNSVSDDYIEYSLLTFKWMIGPYFLFTFGAGLKCFWVATNRPKYMFYSSAFVNLLIYLPMGLMVRYRAVTISYRQLMIVSIAVFVLDALITAGFLYFRGTVPKDVVRREAHEARRLTMASQEMSHGHSPLDKSMTMEQEDCTSDDTVSIGTSSSPGYAPDK